MNGKCCGDDSCNTIKHQAVDQPISKQNTAAYISEFSVAKMDCPSEERMIRLALDGLQQQISLEFDIPNRKVRVFHSGKLDEIQSVLTGLGLGAILTSTQEIGGEALSQAQSSATEREARDASVLKLLLAINALMFTVELVVGWLAQSTGLIADSLDMFADAAVYGLALYAVGHSTLMKVRAAHISGWLQILLAVGALLEVGRRFWFGSEPVSALMMCFGALALLANVFCLVLITKNKGNGAHMKASWIFSANDVIANSGVILAGMLVAWTGSRYPDLIIGFIIALIVLNGARSILKIKS